MLPTYSYLCLSLSELKSGRKSLRNDDHNLATDAIDKILALTGKENPVLRLKVNSKYTEDMFNGFPVLLDTSK